MCVTCTCTSVIHKLLCALFTTILFPVFACSLHDYTFPVFAADPDVMKMLTDCLVVIQQNQAVIMSKLLGSDAVTVSSGKIASSPVAVPTPPQTSDWTLTSTLPSAQPTTSILPLALPTTSSTPTTSSLPVTSTPTPTAHVRTSRWFGLHHEWTFECVGRYTSIPVSISHFSTYEVVSPKSKSWPFFVRFSYFFLFFFLFSFMFPYQTWMQTYILRDIRAPKHISLKSFP